MSAAKAKYATEAALCEAFIAALPDGWVAYAETAGWDILLVRAEDGLQIGVEAKLRLNLEVVEQCLKGHWMSRTGPDYRAVLVPSGGLGERTSAHLGIVVLTISPREKWERVAYVTEHVIFPRLPTSKQRYGDRGWHDWAPEARCELPEYIPDVPAGDTAPVQLTSWKIGALRICALIERFGGVERADFRELQIDASRWLCRGGWLDRGDRGWAFSKRCPDFRAQHATVYPQVVADFGKWCPAHRKVAEAA